MGFFMLRIPGRAPLDKKGAPLYKKYYFDLLFLSLMYFVLCIKNKLLILLL